MVKRTIDNNLEEFVAAVNAPHSPSDEPQIAFLKLGEGFILADLLTRLRTDVSRKHLVGKRKGKSFRQAIELSGGKLRHTLSKKPWWCSAESADADDWELWEYV